MAIRWSRRARTAGVSVAALGYLGSAQAETPATEFHWQAGASCPDEAAARAKLESYLGQSVEARRDQKLRIDVRVTSTPGSGFAASLEVRSRRGTQRRVLANQDCEKLTEAATLVAALAIDPSLNVAVEPPPPPAPIAPEESKAQAPAPPDEPVRRPPITVAAKAPSAASQTQRAPAARRPPSSPAEGWTMSAAAMGIASGGALPDVGWGLGGRALIGRGRLGATVWGEYLFPRFGGFRNNSGVDVDLWVGGAGPCLLLRLAEPTLKGCLVGALGDMRGVGAGVERPRHRHARWSAVLLELLAEESVGSWGLLMAGLQGGDALEAPRFGIVVDGHETEAFGSHSWYFSAFAGIGFTSR